MAGSVQNVDSMDRRIESRRTGKKVDNSTPLTMEESVKLNKSARERLLAAEFTSKTFVEVAEQMVEGQERFGTFAPSQLPIDYQQDGDVVEPGDMIPVILIGIRPATLPEPD